MIVLVILNIILIVLLTVMSIYFFRNNKNKDIDKYVCANDDKNNVSEHTHRKKVKSDRVFVGRFIDDEEYQQMMDKRRSDISILLEDVTREYEHLKRLNNERTEGNNPR